MKQLFSFMLLMSITFFMACKGEQGPQGPAGTNGTNGTNGIDGNANVKSSTIAVTAANWTVISDYESETTLNVPIITADIANTGIVAVYWKYSWESSWHALPYAVSYSAYTESYSYAFTTGQVTLRVTANDGFASEPEVSVRVVAASSVNKTNPNIDWNDYTNVQEQLGLPE